MKKLITLVLLAALGFYVAWPAWSAYTLANALMAGDEATVARKIDFTSVRTSLKPVVEQQVEQEVDKQMKQVGGGIGAMLGGDVKKKLTGDLVNTVLTTVVTPQNVIRITRQGGNAADTVREIVSEQMAKAGGLPGLGGGGGSSGGIKLPGGLGGLAGAAGVALPGLGGLGGGSAPTAAPAAKAPAPAAASDKKPSFGLGNIKGFGFEGLTGITVSVAKDPSSSKADVTAGMKFTGFDWKVSKVVPHL